MLRHTIILSVAIRSVQLRPARNPTCSSRSFSSSIVLICSEITLQNTSLLAMLKGMMPRQFLQWLRSPFLAASLADLSSTPVVLAPHSVSGGRGPKEHPLTLQPPALITSGSVLSHPGAYPFFNFFIAFLISARVMRPVFMFRSSLSSTSGGMGGSSWLLTPLDYPITELEIRTAVKKLKNNKSPYSDKIRNEMIKASLNEMMPVYHKLFNNILNGGSMSLMWCSGLITPIFKSGGRNDPTNYRGICVSSCLGKLFCSILNQRLMEHVNSLNILHNSQIGFLPNN